MWPPPAPKAPGDLPAMGLGSRPTAPQRRLSVEQFLEGTGVEPLSQQAQSLFQSPVAAPSFPGQGMWPPQTPSSQPFDMPGPPPRNPVPGGQGMWSSPAPATSSSSRPFDMPGPPPSSRFDGLDLGMPGPPPSSGWERGGMPSLPSSSGMPLPPPSFSQATLPARSAAARAVAAISVITATERRKSIALSKSTEISSPNPEMWPPPNPSYINAPPEVRLEGLQPQRPSPPDFPTPAPSSETTALKSTTIASQVAVVQLSSEKVSGHNPEMWPPPAPPRGAETGLVALNQPAPVFESSVVTAGVLGNAPAVTEQSTPPAPMSEAAAVSSSSRPEMERAVPSLPLPTTPPAAERTQPVPRTAVATQTDVAEPPQVTPAAEMLPPLPSPLLTDAAVQSLTPGLHLAETQTEPVPLSLSHVAVQSPPPAPTSAAETQTQLREPSKDAAVQGPPPTQSSSAETQTDKAPQPAPVAASADHPKVLRARPATVDTGMETEPMEGISDKIKRISELEKALKEEKAAVQTVGAELSKVEAALARKAQGGPQEGNMMISVLRGQIGSLKGEVERQKKSAHEKEQEVEKLRMSLRGAEGQAARLQEQLARQEAEAARSSDELERAKSEAEELKGKKQEAEDFKAQLTTASAQVTLLSNELEALRSEALQLKERQQEAESLKSQLADASAQVTRLSRELEVARSEAAEQLKSMQQEAESFKAQLAAALAQAEELKAQLHHSESKADSLKAELATGATEADALQAQFHEASEKVHSLNQQVGALQDEVASTQKKLQSVEARDKMVYELEVRPLEQQLETLQAEAAKTREEREKAEARCAEYREDMKRMEREVEPLKQQLCALQEEAATTKRELDSALVIAAQSQGDLAKLKLEVEPMKQKLQTFQGEVESTKKELEGALAQAVRSQGEVKSLETEVVKLRRAAGEAEKLQAEASGLRKELASARDEAQKAKEGAGKDRQEAARISEELKASQEEAKNLRAELNAALAEILKSRTEKTEAIHHRCHKEIQTEAAVESKAQKRGSVLKGVEEEEDVTPIAAPKIRVSSAGLPEPGAEEREEVHLRHTELYDEEDMWDPEHIRVLVAKLFPKHDVDGNGHLTWDDGECMRFLHDFFWLHGQPPPKTPTAVFRSLYSQVKSSSSGTPENGLTSDEMAEFCIKVHGFVYKSLGQEMRAQRKSFLTAGMENVKARASGATPATFAQRRLSQAFVQISPNRRGSVFGQ